MDQVISQQELNAVYDNNLLGRLTDLLNRSNPMEKKLLLKILEELSITGESETLETVYLTDFKEVPVSIDTFLCDPEYLGGSNKQGEQIYPGWWDVYHDVFDYQKDIYEVLLSGATRIGKSSTAVSCMCYMLYLLMCYRNPQEYFGLKEVSRATIAFANLTKDLALGVAYREFHDTLIKSPWFMRHGTKNNSATRPIYIPEGNQIEIVAASDGAHVLGMQLWACLVGDTQIVTDSGIHKIKDLVNQTTQVKQYDYINNTFEYASATVVETKLATELISIELEDGTIITGTPEHKILLSNGEYKMLQELTDDDDVMTLREQAVINEVKLVIGEEYKNHGIWKFIPDGTNHHAICSYGDMVVRIPYLDTIGRRVAGKVFSFRELSGYYTVLHEFVHRLMIQTFMPDTWNPALDVNHKDGNKHNNHIDNLEMVTRSENLKHFWRADCFEDTRNKVLSVTHDAKVQRATGNTYGAGRKHIHRGGEHKTCLIDELPIYLSQGWELGTDIVTRSNTGMIWVTDGINNQMILESDLCNLDLNVWHRGMTKPKGLKVWIHKEQQCKKVCKTEVDKYLSSGWELGSNVCTKGNTGKVTITDGIHNRMIPISELSSITAPWRRGQTKKHRVEK